LSEENTRVHERVEALTNLSQFNEVFWTSKSKVATIAKFQDRVRQVHRFFDKCHAGLRMIWKAMFPLNYACKWSRAIHGAACPAQLNPLSEGPRSMKKNQMDSSGMSTTAATPLTTSNSDKRHGKSAPSAHHLRIEDLPSLR
jgi:hypothetical protein